MAKVVLGYADNKGTMYPTPRQAIKSDLAAIFGPSCEGMAHGIAGTIIDQREAIEACFADLDAMTAPKETDK